MDTKSGTKVMLAKFTYKNTSIMKTYCRLRFLETYYTTFKLSETVDQ